MSKINPKYLILLILGVAFFVRILGINYGLPLWLISDEPPSIFGALKMIELKTLIPMLHIDAFQKVLYYPLYLSYTYLIPFGFAAGIKYVFFNGNFEQFKNFLIADPSIFFIIARIFSVIFGTLTVWLVYKIGKNLFESEAAAILSAALLALSYMHVNFSHWGRHWIPATFIFALIVYYLSRKDLGVSKKYLTASVLSGIGVGINYQVALSAFFIVLWFIFYDKLFSTKIFRERWIYFCIFLFLFFAFLAYILYPAGLVVGKNDIVGIERNISGFFQGYAFYFFTLFYNDPILLLFALVGLFFSFLYNKRYFITVASFIILYIAFFYFVFFHVDRYVLMLLPVFALTAGYGFLNLWKRFYRNFRFLMTGFGLACLLSLLIVIARFDLILLRNDTRIQVIKWIESTIQKDQKVAILVPSMRLPATAAAIEEQANIDSESLRQVDMAETKLKGGSRYYALNLCNVRSEFFKDFFEYLKSNNYKYLIFSDYFAREEGVLNIDTMGIPIRIFEGFNNENGDIVNWFSGGDLNSRQTIPYFSGGILRLFRMENNGPRIIVNKL